MKILLSTLLACFTGIAAHAYTFDVDTVRCPIDSEQVIFHVTMSYTTTGSYMDFEKKGFIGDHYEQLVNGCKRCHFCGYRDDFDTTYTGATKQALLDLLKAYKHVKFEGATKYEIAAKIQEYFHAENDHIGWLYLTGSYLLRDDRKPATRRKEFQQNAISWLEKSLAANELKDTIKVPNIYYLVGELYRRTGQFDKAIEYYDRALNATKKEDWLEEVAKKQKALAEKKDDDNSI